MPVPTYAPSGGLIPQRVKYSTSAGSAPGAAFIQPKIVSVAWSLRTLPLFMRQASVSPPVTPLGASVRQTSFVTGSIS